MSEKGVSLIEALVATLIIGIGFVAVFQMVQYSIRSIDVSGERTKATYLSSMIAEDIYSDKNQEKDSKKFIDKIYDSPWELAECKNIGGGIENVNQKHQAEPLIERILKFLKFATPVVMLN